MIDLNHIPERHEAINLRLEEWARWVKVRPQAWAMQPMFRFARSNSRQWETDPHIHIEINTLAAHEIEKAVSSLPPKHRTALRWSYVFSFVPVGKMQRELGLTREAIRQMLDDARDMLRNQLRQKIVEK
ncbi:MAG: hypothetical protein JJD98_00430 [Polaromonas sp.]|nr:hypothetical protein [Polaromonas sp.]